MNKFKAPLTKKFHQSQKIIKFHKKRKLGLQTRKFKFEERNPFTEESIINNIKQSRKL